MSREQLYIGTSGLVLPYKNKLAYPAEMEGRSRLQVYGTLLNSIEVNSIFYKLPRAATISQWSGSVGPGFRFTFKLWKQITHSKGLDFNRADLQQYFDVIAGAKEKQGCLLVQFPASVKRPLLKNVAALLSALQEVNRDEWPVAVEFRSASWYCDSTYELLDEYKAAMVFHDKSDSTSPHPELDAPHIYLRFHGPEGNYRGSYDPGFLHEYAGYISGWLAAGKAVYVYFNNTMGAALENLKMLARMLREDFATESSNGCCFDGT